MFYGITKFSNNFTEKMLSDRRIRILKSVLFFIPRANPDNERLYPKVDSWALELDEKGWPQREVGLNAEGRPLFNAPNARNTGFWPDMAAMQFKASELMPISKQDFEQLWLECEKNT